MSMIEKTPLAGQVYKHLLRRIIDKTYPAGSKLVEENIAAELGVSRTPLREALQRLMQEGFVEHQPRRGMRVRQLRRRDVEDIFELRGNLERMAFRNAQRQITEADLAQLEKIIAESEKSSVAQRRSAIMAADDCLHELFCRRCTNSYLSEYLLHLLRLSRPYRNLGADRQANIKHLHQQRREILAAIRRKQMRAAEKLIVRHIREGKQMILEHFPDAN